MGPFDGCRPHVSRLQVYLKYDLTRFRGTVIATTGHEEDIIYADIEPTKLKEARAGIPITTQRRFDVYKDVAEELILPD